MSNQSTRLLALKPFSQTACDYCNLIDQLVTLTPRAFCHKLEHILARLACDILKLNTLGISTKDSDFDQYHMTYNEWETVAKAISGFLSNDIGTLGR